MRSILAPLRPLPLAVLWTLGILLACSLPGESLPSVGLFAFDKLIHFGLFAGFGVLWCWALPGRTTRVLLFGLAYAVLTEVYQGFLPFERTPDPYDALANALGLLTAIFFVTRYLRRLQRATH